MFTRDILLLYPGLNQFSQYSSNITKLTDLESVLAAPIPGAILGLDLLLHFMADDYLSGDATRQWIQDQIGTFGKSLAQTCTDVASISGIPSTIGVGSATQGVAVRFTPTGSPVVGASFLWTSSDPSIAQITPQTGRLVGVSAGTVQISAVSGDARAVGSEARG